MIWALPWILCFQFSNSPIHETEIGVDHCSSSDTACLIVFDSKVDKVVLGQTTIRELLDLYGKSKVRKRKFPRFLGIGPPHVVKSVEYPEIGMKFEFDKTIARRKLGKRKVNIIELDHLCECRTSHGLGIGSDFESIVEEFRTWELPSFGHKNSADGVYAFISYKKYSGENDMISVELISSPVESFGKGFIVKKIRIVYFEDR